MRYLYFLLLCAFPTLVLADQLIIEPDMGRAPILERISGAKHTIHLMMYGLTDKTLLDALIKQKERGRTVQIILEKTPYKAINENVKAIAALKHANVALQGSIPNIRLIHQKTLITDGQEAMVMTFNFTNSAFKNDRNFALVVDDAKTVKEIAAVFAADWNHVTYTDHPDNLLYSPDDSRTKLLGLIRDAKKSIKIYAQSLTDYQITGALADRARQGVEVSILSSNRMKPKAQAYLMRAGVKLHHSKHRYIHAKVMIFDDESAIVGSINLTPASIDTNRELSVITRDKSVVNQLAAQFAKDLV